MYSSLMIYILFLPLSQLYSREPDGSSFDLVPSPEDDSLGLFIAVLISTNTNSTKTMAPSKPLQGTAVNLFICVVRLSNTIGMINMLLGFNPEHSYNTLPKIKNFGDSFFCSNKSANMPIIRVCKSMNADAIPILYSRSLTDAWRDW